MGAYLELMAGAGLEVYIIIGIFVLALVWFGIRIAMGKHNVSQPIIIPKPVTEEADETTTAELGTGSFNAMCFRKVGNLNVVDFTSIPKPKGEAYEFETSLPFSGAGYIVEQGSQGVLDYDPRKVSFKFMESPQVAWFARHWGIVKDVFAVPLSAWKSPSTWFAIAMIIVVFVCGLVVFD